LLKCYSEPVSFSTQVKNRCYEHVFFNFKKTPVPVFASPAEDVD